MASATLFKDRMVKSNMIPGNTTSHQASNSSLAPAKSEPQVTRSTGTPSPRKDRDDSVMIADAMQATKATDITGVALGNACLNKMRRGEAPDDFADAMKSVLLIRRSSARVNLAMSVQ